MDNLHYFTLLSLSDLLIAIAFITALKWFSGLIGNTSAKDELSQKDNPAFGISLAGSILALSVILTGAVSGEFGAFTKASFFSSLLDEITLLIAYGLFGIVLMGITRILFDHISLPNISIHDLIMQKNIAAGIVDAGNMLATALIISAIMSWVESITLYGLWPVFLCFIFSQILLLLLTKYRVYIYRRTHQRGSLEEQIQQGNTALALRFTGQRIGTAFAVTATSSLVPYILDELYLQLGIWFATALALSIMLTILEATARRIILKGINTADEIDKQQNIAIGAIQFTLYLAIGLIMTAVLG